jgi:TRAP-type transport system small permease protein
MTVDSTRRGPTNPFEWLLYGASALLMFGIVCVMTYIVVMRYYFGAPPIWSEDIPKLMFVWLVFLAIGLAIKAGINIRVTVLTQRLPRRIRLSVEVAMHVLVLTFIGTLFVQSFPVVELALGGRMLSTGWSNAVAVVPLTFGAALIFFYQGRLLWIAARALRDGGEDTPPVDPTQQAGIG